MKISKSNLLCLSSIFTILGFGLLAISMADRQLSIDINNASQFMNSVKFISTGSTDSATLHQIGSGSVKIDTNNFILTQTGTNENAISTGSYSSILGGKSNNISGNSNVILGGEDNSIDGEYNVILGGRTNKIENGGKYSSIIGGKFNTIKGNNAVILGSGNVEGTGSVVVGKESTVNGNHSAALGLKSTVQANNSFLWNDGTNPSSLNNDNLFVVMAKSGMVINSNTAHSFAKLNIGGPLIISSKNTDENIICESGNGKGILKAMDNEDQICLCSCDGLGRNSMLGKGKCLGVCDSSIKPKCGSNVERVFTGGFIIYSGTCENGIPVGGTGAYLVTKNNEVHRSCQTDDGQVIGCTGTVSNLLYEACGSPLPPSGEGIIKGSSSYINTTGPKSWTYTGSSTPGTCEWTCDSANGYHKDGESCVNRYLCSGDINSFYIYPNSTTIGANKTDDRDIADRGWIYTTNETPGACEFTCNTGYRYNNELKICEHASSYCPSVITLDNTGYCTDGTITSVDDVDNIYYEWSCGESTCRICTNGNQYDRDEEDNNGGCDVTSLCCPTLPSNAETFTGIGGDGCYRTPRSPTVSSAGTCSWDGHNFAVDACDYVCASQTTSETCKKPTQAGSLYCDCSWSIDPSLPSTPSEHPGHLLWSIENFKCKEGYERVGNCKCEKVDLPGPGPGGTDCDSVCGVGASFEYDGSCYSCFISGTKVTMADGSMKNIEDVKIGEKVLGSNGTINTVLGYDRPVLGNRHLWSINGSEYFVSDEHPFMTTEGWKSFNPKMTKIEINLNTTELKIGDILITENGEEEIKSVDYIDADYNTPLYNLVLDGDHTYHANGYLVHNKQSAATISPGGSCGGGRRRVDILGTSGKACCPRSFSYAYSSQCVNKCN